MFNSFPRCFAATASLATIVFAVSACGSSAGGGEDGSTSLSMAVSVGSPNGQTAIEELIAQFETANPNINIEPQFTPFQTFDNVVSTQISAGNAPDIIYYVAGSAVPVGAQSLAKKDLLLDMSEKPWAQELPDVFKEALGADGEVNALPTTANFFGAVYNMTLLKENGTEPPRTWSDLLKYCSTMRDAGITPFINSLGEPNAVQQNFGPLDATTVYSDNQTWDRDRIEGTTTFADAPGWTEAMKKYLEMRDAGCYPPDALSTDQNTAFGAMNSGTASGWFAGIRVLPYLEGSEFEFAPVPARDSGNWVLGGADDAWMVTATTDHPDEAMQWIDFMAEPENTSWLAESFGGISRDDYVSGNFPEGLDEQLSEAIRSGQVSPLHRDWAPGVVNNVMGPGLQSLYLGDTDIPTLLKSMDQAWDATASN